MSENKKSCAHQAAGAAQGLSTNQLVVVVLIPSLATALEHLIYEGRSARVPTLVFAALSLLAVILSVLAKRYLSCLRRRSALPDLVSTPRCPERRWPLVFRGIQRGYRKAKNRSGPSPAPEPLAIVDLQPSGDRILR